MKASKSAIRDANFLDGKAGLTGGSKIPCIESYHAGNYGMPFFHPLGWMHREFCRGGATLRANFEYGSQFNHYAPAEPEAAGNAGFLP